jgi:hypothetical protein
VLSLKTLRYQCTININIQHHHQLSFPPTVHFPHCHCHSLLISAFLLDSPNGSSCRNIILARHQDATLFVAFFCGIRFVYRCCYCCHRWQESQLPALCCHWNAYRSQSTYWRETRQAQHSRSPKRRPIMVRRCRPFGLSTRMAELMILAGLCISRHSPPCRACRRVICYHTTRLLVCIDSHSGKSDTLRR